MNTQTAPAQVEGPRLAPVRVPKVIVGDIVHYYDETRFQAHGDVGIGPYAALVVAIKPLGVSLEVFGPNSGRFPVDGVRHRAELGDQAGRKRWWEPKPRA